MDVLRGRIVIFGKNVVCGLLRLCRSLDDEAVIVFEALKPSSDIRGAVIDGAFHDSSMAAKERGTHFGDKFLLRVGRGTKGAPFTLGTGDALPV